MAGFAVSAAVTATEIKEKRKELGLTQKQLAELIGVSKPTVERWETSDNKIKGPAALLLRLLTPEYLQKIAIPEKKYSVRLWYMYKDELCTLIDVDEKTESVLVKNYTQNLQFRAFGINEHPSFEDYNEFLKSRCFPESRDKMKLILKDLNLPFYDPFMIIEKTKGRMAEDDFWIQIER